MIDVHGFQRVSAENPCPLCGKRDWCLITRDGTAVICPRTRVGATKNLGESGWLHHLTDCRGDPILRPPSAVSSTPAGRKTLSPIALQTILAGLQDNAGPELSILADQLGLDLAVLKALRVGYCSDEKCWTFPERDAQGEVIGIQRRSRDGSKRRFAGGKAGLTYADNWDTGSGPLLLVEGASDVAAAMMLGFSAIGRPSNRGGIRLLAEKLQTFPEDRQIIVLGERDRKESGLWPGREGAMHTSTELAKRLSRPMFWALPPDKCKDLRAWTNKYATRDPDQMGELFLEGLDVETVVPPPMQRARIVTEPILPDDDYRTQMLKARLQSLDRPGIYLDRSGTGRGKSSIDFEVILSMQSRVEEN